MSKLSNDLNGILSIEPLPAPLSYWEPLIFSAISLLVLIVFAFFIHALYFSTRGKFKHKLNNLHNKFELQEVSSHDIAFQLANILQHGLRVHTLSERTVLPEQLISSQSRWNAFVQDLSVARYSSNEYPNEGMQLLFAEARFFLRQCT